MMQFLSWSYGLMVEKNEKLLMLVLIYENCLNVARVGGDIFLDVRVFLGTFWVCRWILNVKNNKAVG